MQMYKQLKVINLRENKLKQLDCVFGGHEKISVDTLTYDLTEVELEYINLESNLFSDFPYKAFEDKTQKSLKKIDLSRNRIAKI